ncbi:MAG: hypothetical protein ACRC7N_14645 [Clostridium sp.]
MEKDLKIIQPDKEANSYSVQFDDKGFYIGLAERSSEQLNIKAHMFMRKDEFKGYFKEILKAIRDHDIKTETNFIKEVCLELESEGV